MPTIRIPPRNYNKSGTSSSSTSLSSSTTSRDRSAFGLEYEEYEQSEDDTVPVSAADKSRRQIAGSNRVLKFLINQASADGQTLHSFNTQPVAASGFVDTSSLQENQRIAATQPIAVPHVAPAFGVNSNVQNSNMEYAMDVDMDITMEDVSHS